jgi:hypothetical protein
VSTPEPVSTPAAAPSGGASLYLPQAGRPKLRRWIDTSPASLSGGSCQGGLGTHCSSSPTQAPTTFLEAVIKGPIKAACPPSVQKFPEVHGLKLEALRQSSAPEAGRCPATQYSRDEEGWQLVERRRSRQVEREPRRRSPVDLRGKCYKCLSTSHFVAACRRPPRCFGCLHLGHRVAQCPTHFKKEKKPLKERLGSRAPRTSVWQRIIMEDGGRALTPTQANPTQLIPTKLPVWRRLSPPVSSEVPPPLAMAVGSDIPHKRKRRRGKGGRADPQVKHPSGSAGEDDAHPATATHNMVARPSCVLDFSSDMAREEAALRRALFVTIIGTRPEVLGSEVIEEVARSFEIEADSMSIHQTFPEDFILILSDEDAATKVLNGGRVLRGPQFHIQFKRWTRLAHATAAALPSLVDIEIQGIPLHAWGRSTAEQLLGNSCWIIDVHPDTSLKSDFSAFRLRAWCCELEKLQRAMNLVIAEPTPADHVKRCLSYSIEVTVTPVEKPLSDGTPPPPPGNDNRHEDGDRRRPEAPSPRRRREDLQRGPIHQRLGPHAPVNDCGRGSANHNTSVAPEAPRSVETATVQVPRATRSGEAATVQVPTLDDEVFSAPLPVLELSALSGDVFRPAAVGVKSHGGEAEEKNCFRPEVASGLMSGTRVQPPNSNEALLAVEVVGPLEWARQTSPQLSGLLMVPGPVSPHSLLRNNLLGSSVLDGPLESGALVSPQHTFAGSLELSVQISPPPEPAWALSLVAAQNKNLTGQGSTSLKVYTRRTADNRWQKYDSQDSPLIQALQPNQVSSPLEQNGIGNAVQAFVDKVTRKVDGLLPPPLPHRRRSKQLPSDFIPRRSSRLAKRDDKTNAARRQIQADLIRSLDVPCDGELLSPKALEAYGNLFKNSLSEAHIKALSALFGWTVPDVFEPVNVLCIAGQGPEDLE